MAPRVGIDREQVVRVAAELADTQGLEQLTLAQVAQRLGVRLPSLYNHVDGLPGLRRDLSLYSIRRFGERISRAAIGKAGDQAVMALADAARAFVTEHPGMYAATIRAPEPDDLELQQESQEIIQTILAVLEPYHLSEADATHAVRGLRSIIHGFTSIEQAGGFAMSLDRNESYHRLLHAYLAGLWKDSQNRAS